MRRIAFDGKRGACRISNHGRNMFIDPHVHSSGVSYCAKVTCEQIIDFKRSSGYDGLVLTNHYNYCYGKPEECALQCFQILKTNGRRKKRLYKKCRYKSISGTFCILFYNKLLFVAVFCPFFDAVFF